MDNFKSIWSIYLDSFPKEERRTLDQQTEIMKDKLYSLEGVYHNEKLIGFYALWNLEEFVFIEHIAINKEFRGMGYGSKIMQEIIIKHNKQIVLEVEYPENYYCIKRIEFYKKLGFNLNDFKYEQPPYQKEYKAVPLLIMSYPQAIKAKEFLSIKDKLYKYVYKIDK